MNYIGIAGVALAALTSCDLDLYPINAIVNDYNNSPIVEESDLVSFENGILASYRGRFRGDNWTVEEIMYGYFNAAADFGNNFGAPHRLESNIADDYDIRDFWSGHYGSIKNDNVLISAVNTMKTESLKEKAAIVKGYAFLFRADSHLQLVRHYGNAYGSTSSSDLGVPVITEFDLNAKPARNTVQEVYDQIKADLDSAAVLLASKPGKIAAQKPTIDCVYALYARYYLDTKDYAKAVEYAEKVINSTAGYSLLNSKEAFADYYENDVNDAGSEAIMQMYISSNETGNGYGAFTSLADYSSEGKDYVYIPYFIPTQTLIDLYEEDDLRFISWFNKDKRYVRQNSSFYKGDFYIFNKFEGNKNWTTAKKAPTNAVNATRPYTLPEMYLIAAEAGLLGGNTATAEKYLGALQTSRKATVTVANMENIQKEWNKETIGEGMRLSNLKRWGVGFSARTAQPGALANFCVMEGEKYTGLSMSNTDFHLSWPIPTYELQVNDNLVQNDGYTADK